MKTTATPQTQARVADLERQLVEPPPAPQRRDTTGMHFPQHRTPRIMGLDLSPRGTGVLELSELGYPERRLFFTGTKKHVEAWKDEPDHVAVLSEHVGEYDEAGQFQRAIHTAETVLGFIAQCAPAVVAIEQIPFSAEGKHRDQLYWIHTMVVYGLTSGGLSYSEKTRPLRYYRATDVKLFATGMGNAKKPHMVAAADGAGFECSRYGDPGEDLADAFWVARMLRLELLLRAGKVQQTDLDGDALRVFFPHPKRPKKNRDGTPKKQKTQAPTYLERPFIQIGGAPYSIETP